MAQLPGRPGNLTPEEEAKLRKFWEMFLHVCGVLGEETTGKPEATPEPQGQTGATESEKPKKKRMSLPFRKKEKDKGTATPPRLAVMDGIKENDPEDKWGENKAYFDTLATHPPEQIRATIWSMVKHDHPDALLLRFLRARKWNLQRALVMLMSTMNWRCSEARVDDEIMANGEEFATANEKSSDQKSKKLAEDFLAQIRMGKSYCYGVDKAGRPICVVRARLHKAGEQSEEGLERFTVYLIETTRFMLNHPIDTACVLFDLTGFSLANMDYTPVRFMIKCFEANYPESLGVVLVHKAPWVFQGIWKIVRGWLDPVVASKVHFTNTLKDLEEFISAERIPTELEGTSGYTYSYVEPVPGENAKMKDVETKEKLLREREILYEEYESRTIEWISADAPEKRAAIHEERDEIARKLREQYWRLDPYIRSRSYYDRIGVIKPGGDLDYYPPKITPATNGTTAVVSLTPPAGETSVDDVD
ncbi:CRAL/TRIO domain-containing protein [Durotheca rogersii]|uniref:CRAL/TRIO domain-containing protein n=1 Tax=Durotheca rogersii TaxID=419775 RepID=UPI002220F7F2|nr:CRAL/TRIO domain-containing protein [Durotheca rogersii]KAI5863584.1 CRAL/TRIO domain-containing protein [Durotheca rogersii]